MKKGYKKCSSCGKEIHEITKECPYCGKYPEKMNNNKRKNVQNKTNIESDKYTKNLKKVITIKDEVFEYKKNQIFYRNNITQLGYYWWRFLIVIILLFAGIWPGLILLGIIFFDVKPRNRFLLINDNVIGYYNKGHFLGARTHRKLINKHDVTKIEVVGKKKAIYVNRIKKNGKEKYFYFGKIYNYDKLIDILKQQGYKVVSVENYK